MATIPRYAMWRGQRVMIMHYEGNGSFMCLDKSDDRRLIPRSQLTFVKGKKK